MLSSSALDRGKKERHAIVFGTMTFLTPLFSLQVGTLLTSGMVLFSGSCYYHALTENAKVRVVTPYGGVLLILGWLAMML